jgi:hypothetical protein
MEPFLDFIEEKVKIEKRTEIYQQLKLSVNVAPSTFQYRRRQLYGNPQKYP